MRIGYVFYEFKSEELRGLVKKMLKDRSKAYDAWGKFAKKYKMDHRGFWTSKCGETETIRAFHKGARLPDENIWRPGKDYDSYIPRGNTKEGRKVRKEYNELPKWGSKELKAAVKYDWIHDDNIMYFFSWFRYSGGYCGMKVPLFAAESYKRNKTLKYKPVKGMKEVSWKTHNKKSVMKSKEYLASL